MEALPRAQLTWAACPVRTVYNAVGVLSASRRQQFQTTLHKRGQGQTAQVTLRGSGVPVGGEMKPGSRADPTGLPGPGVWTGTCPAVSSAVSFGSECGGGRKSRSAGLLRAGRGGAAVASRRRLCSARPLALWSGKARPTSGSSSAERAQAGPSEGPHWHAVESGAQRSPRHLLDRAVGPPSQCPGVYRERWHCGASGPCPQDWKHTSSVCPSVHT